MKSRSKKHKGSRKSVDRRDRLSELPDEVIVHILSFLPTVDAVRTVLLHRFGNLWTLVPNLGFYGKDWEDDEDYREEAVDVFTPFSQFVYNVLILHRRPTIREFVLEMYERSWEVAENAVAKIAVEVWIRFALSREAEVLKLHFDHCAPFSTPSFVFTSQSLVMLKLQHCSTQLPSRVHMGSLQTLEFISVVVDKGDLNEFLIGCPCLQRILLGDTVGIQDLSFSAPSIKELEFWEVDGYSHWTINCPNLKILDLFVCLQFLKVINVPSVRELILYFAYHHETDTEENAYRFKRFLEGFQNVEVLTLKEEVVMQLNYCLIMNVGFPRNRWKRVTLQSGIQSSNFAGICSLVRNSPCLEELVIHANEMETELLFTVDSFSVHQATSFPCVARHLKLVSMHGYDKPYDSQLRLIEFLLKSSINLDKLVIFSNQGCQLTSEEEQQFVKQLSNFSRASPKARIVITD